MEFTFKLVGCHTNAWAHTYDELKIDAETEQEAVKQAEKWCEDHSFMGGYDWKIDDYFPKEKPKYIYSKTCYRCGCKYHTVVQAYLPNICGVCASDLSDVKVEISENK